MTTQTQTKPAEHAPEGYSDIIDPQVLVDIITERDSLKAERDTLLAVCNALLDRFQTNNGKAALDAIQQRGWASRLRDAICKAERVKD